MRPYGRWVAGAVLAAAALVVLRASGVGAGPPTAKPIEVTRAYIEFTDTLRRGETFAHVLTRAGLSGREQVALLAAANGLDARRLRAGQRVRFRRVIGTQTVDRVMVRPGPDRRVWVRRAGGDSGWVGSIERIEFTATRVLTTGTIKTSLYDALDVAISDTLLPVAERRMLAWAIADVYDWELDFTRDVRPGDRFDILFERLESQEHERRFGRILAARVEAAGSSNYAFWYATADGSGFYDDQGRSLRRAFLRAPLEFRRISSRFGGRYHPVLKRWRSHQGTDYAADRGTPVRATADGVVTKAGWDGGYGLMVELRHPNGVRTRYGHLSNVGPNVHVGARVTQKQTIGYVGSTGLSTGPHLHYEFLVGGRPTNPQRKDAGAGRAVPTGQRASYDAARERLLNELIPPVAVVARSAPHAARVD